MRDRGLIWIGLAVFLALLAFPAWRNLWAHASAKGPEPVLPKTEKQCVLPVEYMKTSHMKLLLDWRDAAIRRGARDYTAPDGRHFAVSLTATCLRECHGAKTDFCDRCHNYAAVALPCWDCHQDNNPRHPFAPSARDGDASPERLAEVAR
ncbi:MAG TPA: sulfate reduction electron transfer complex DsrMKJOP subunit DsrJ [Bryobacteraceae bacterium]|nr:sulfate reduction electron transfer complex DsrMKJOP subunit DsrJ [Bryobacteraceae bacterium]